MKWISMSGHVLYALATLSAMMACMNAALRGEWQGYAGFVVLFLCITLKRGDFSRPDQSKLKDPI